MAAEVPPALARVADRLSCPHCGQGLAVGPGRLDCPEGHHHDVARQGYVSLLVGAIGAELGDDATMIAARERAEAAAVLAPLNTALAEAVGGRAPEAEPALVIDLGSGTGAGLARVLEALPRAAGVAIDVSRAAARRAARAHPAAASVRADVWRGIPLLDGCVDVAINAFAPRNGAELARVIRPGGRCCIASAAPEHLAELRDLQGISVHPAKAEVIARQLEAGFELESERTLSWNLRLDGSGVATVLAMSPAARHLSATAQARVAAIATVDVTAVVELRVYRRRS